MNPQTDDWLVNQTQFGLTRMNNLPVGPRVDIYGNVEWNKDWDLEKCQRFIGFIRETYTAMGQNTDSPNGYIACMEYSLNPEGKVKPDHLGALKLANPTHTDLPDTYPDGTPTWVDKE